MAETALAININSEAPVRRSPGTCPVLARRLPIARPALARQMQGASPARVRHSPGLCSALTQQIAMLRIILPRGRKRITASWIFKSSGFGILGQYLVKLWIL